MTGPSSAEFSAAYWEDRYRSGVGAGQRGPSPFLVAGTEVLTPGTVLDAGCGVGGDALWLAARGWCVTAVDVSVTALDQGRQAAQAAGPAFAGRIEWVQADLTAWDPGRRTFDLVTSHYVHAPGRPEALLRRLASWVAPGGSLLVVGHDADHGSGQNRVHDADRAHDADRGDDGGHGHGAGHGHGHAHGDAPPPGAQVRAAQLVAALPEGRWDVLAAERRTHTVRRPDDGRPVTLHDVVVHARRRTDPHRPARCEG